MTKEASVLRVLYCVAKCCVYHTVFTYLLSCNNIIVKFLFNFRDVLNKTANARIT